MIELASEPANFVLYDDTGRLRLEVECGTTAVFTLVVELTIDERRAYESRGIAAVRELADDVRTWPSRYESRRI